MEDLFGPVVNSNAASNPPSVETVVAVFDFEAQADGDLGFKTGDKLEVLSKDGQWWKGRFNGKEGLFPFNYVQPENANKPDNSDPLAQSIAEMDATPVGPSNSEVSLLEKVTATDEPIDLQKMLGKEKMDETILAKESRLQNERLTMTMGLGQTEVPIQPVAMPGGPPSTTEGHDLFGSSSLNPATTLTTQPSANKDFDMFGTSSLSPSPTTPNSMSGSNTFDMFGSSPMNPSSNLTPSTDTTMPAAVVKPASTTDGLDLFGSSSLKPSTTLSSKTATNKDFDMFGTSSLSPSPTKPTSMSGSNTLDLFGSTPMNPSSNLTPSPATTAPAAAVKPAEVKTSTSEGLDLFGSSSLNPSTTLTSETAPNKDFDMFGTSSLSPSPSKPNAMSESNTLDMFGSTPMNPSSNLTSTPATTVPAAVVKPTELKTSTTEGLGLFGSMSSNVKSTVESKTVTADPTSGIATTTPSTVKLPEKGTVNNIASLKVTSNNIPANSSAVDKSAVIPDTAQLKVNLAKPIDKKAPTTNVNLGGVSNVGKISPVTGTMASSTTNVVKPIASPKPAVTPLTPAAPIQSTIHSTSNVQPPSPAPTLAPVVPKVAPVAAKVAPVAAKVAPVAAKVVPVAAKVVPVVINPLQKAPEVVQPQKPPPVETQPIEITKPASGALSLPAPVKTKAEEIGLEFEDGGSGFRKSFEEDPAGYLVAVVNSLPARVFIAIIVIMDIVLTIMDLAIQDKTGPDQSCFDWLSFVISLLFIFDVGFRMYGYGLEKYFSDVFEIVDFAIVVVTFTATVLTLALDDSENGNVKFLKVLTFLRVLRIARVIRIITSGTGAARTQVGQNKRRYQKDGFDLDLTYITDQCIAMSFPSEGRTAMFRNPMPEVSRFLKSKHPGNYHVYNLCAERGYEPHWFENRCGRLMVDDHNVPKLEELVAWCKEAKEFTEKDKSNVVVVHCKGGKGRTGTCIAAWMLATDFFSSADDALRHFGERRTDDTKGDAFQGVETPSQSRYVSYFERIKKSGWPKRKKIQINCFTIQNIAPIGRGNGSDIYFKIINYGKEVLFAKVSEEHNCSISIDRQSDRATIHLTTPLIVKDDVKFMFYSVEKSVPKNYEDCAFYFWVNTAFVPASGNLTLERHELDNPHKAKTWKTFTDGFSCTIHSTVLP